MAVTLELGQLCLSHPRAGLRLAANVLATASSPQTTNGEMASANIPAALTSGSAWVCRGRGFHLALNVSVNGSPADSHLQQHLLNSICSADLWEQLNLKARLPPEPILGEHIAALAEGKIAVQLTHSFEAPLNSRHRLPTGASISDVQPPHGVDIVHLESVRLILDLSSSICNKEGANRKAKEIQTQSLSAAYVLMHGDESFARDDHQSTIAQEEVMLLDDLPGMAADATFSAEDDLLLPRTLTIFPRRIDSGTAFTDDQQSKGGAAPHELGQASPEHILELVDCALRLAICEKPLKLPSGIKITRDNVTRLATVAPALWRPHHLKAVSERAPFLPAIAHTLSHSLLVNARSAPLKRKTAELLGRYPPAVTRTGPLSPGDARQYRDPKLVYEAASIELWHLLQRNSFDSGANWRLKPLKTRPQDIGVRDPGESDEMLYENISHFHPGLNHFTDADYSIDSPYSFQDQEPEEMLWELNKEPEESEMDSTYTIPPTPSEKRMAPKISRSSSTDQTMLLDWDNAVKFGHNHVSGNVLEAQGPPATSNPKVAVPFDDVDGEVSLFEVTGQIETIIPVDVYDRLPADPEMLFD